MILPSPLQMLATQNKSKVVGHLTMYSKNPLILILKADCLIES